MRSVSQALTDTDSDGLDDNWENQHFGNLSQSSAGDFDSDGMTNLEEYLHGFSPTVQDAFDDADGDRYPNVFEVRGGSDPNDENSTPTPTYVVNGAGGGTHTTVSAAINAANVANGAYQIIGIAPGVYTGAANVTVSLTTAKPKFLVIGLEGADKTIIDGGGSNWGWNIYNAAVVASLTLRKTPRAFYVEAPSRDVRLVDLLVRDNGGAPSHAAGVHVVSGSAANLRIVGSTFFNNTGVYWAEQIWIGAGAATLVNTVVWGASNTNTMLNSGPGTTLTTNYCLVKGQTLTGTGNLAGSVDAKLRSDARLLWDSPLRGAGGSVAQSRIDMDGELRPSSSPDIGADQFVDTDADDLSDHWELAHAGNLTTLTSRAQDADSDGLTNESEYANLTDPSVADTDGDGLSDGSEVTIHGTNPVSTDTDGDEMPDGWEVSHGLSPLVANRYDDNDGDRYPNIFEYAGGSDPSDANSKPTPTYLVNAAGGGTHTTISAALNAANVQNGAYQIIGIAPGVYTGHANLRGVTVSSTKPKVLFIGLEGASKTIIDGEHANWGWLIQNTTVVSSLTFRRTRGALYVEASGKEVHFADLVVHENTTTPSEWASPGLHVASAAKVHVTGSTFLDNTGVPTVKQIKLDGGAATLATLVNTVVWAQTSGTMLAGSATLTTNHCLVKGQTLSGTGNLAGSVDPKLIPDGHLRWDSPLRGAGGTISRSRIDMDGEVRPSSSPDIGADQFVDTDADDLSDHWELAHAGNLTTLTSRAQDADSDGLTNESEYANLTDPTGADTDGDGLSDGSEVTAHGTNPVSTDTDGDEMPDGWEVSHGLSPLVANRYDDDDGDRYPNIFEYAGGSDPSDANSKPTPTYLVNAAGGGTHTTISAALNAANVQNGAYQIIGIAPGVYTGNANLRGVTVSSAKPKVLFIGLEGASKTIIDGEHANWGWLIQNTTVVSSLTFRRTRGALYVEASEKEVHLVDLLVQNNTTTPSEWASPGLHVSSAAKVHVTGSTFLDNTGVPTVKQIKLDGGAATLATLVNTVVWAQTSGTMLAGSATLTTNHCLVKGQSLSGTGNLAGSVDPKLRSDGRLRSDSPLRGAGGTVLQSRIDMDGALRPASAPDIGVHQFNDVDADGLPDAWEVAHFGATSSISGTSDDDGDDLDNSGEYNSETDHLNPDTDGDGAWDGLELAHGTNPLAVDFDDVANDANGDAIIDSIGVQLGYQSHLDSDGDSLSNEDEALTCTNPLRADTDGDGVPDDVDVFPLDPLISALPSDPQDVTPPAITLTTPWYAVEQ